ncbi:MULTISPECIES: hypothetical protein [Acinetobacter]|jgi:hypothetical protein|uniref:hypothetical protein n=1 Tax=Acinetobacter TaxID=469 RepID=UPI000263DE64|nr:MULTISPECIES: hypothetical protein [Acinetobacter]AWD70845.1 hypothetical protein C0119_11750 [Acinetobacter schindleri]EIM38758.1 hypothetical protein HADU_10652 [Acinetobacter sp. HA]MCO8066536.1 hypothetical protein [Acinetobacter schindleri]MDP1444031.1 hypothetical protein [Acinetobacter schindleri]QIC60356.1 hypothetical protein FSC12_02850 [Acinetobacter schindleri]
MLNNNKNMIIGIAMIFFSGLALMLLLMKDEDSIAKAEHSSLDEQPVLIQQESQLPDPTPMLENEQKIAQQNQQIIQKRDDLYMQLADISNHLSQGRKPDLREVSRILEMQRQLVKVKVISVQEATATIQFLQKVLPEMESELAREIKLIE